MDDRNRVVAMDEEEVEEQEERPGLGLGLGFSSQENDRRYELSVCSQEKQNQ
jgi:hypothetical protein